MSFIYHQSNDILLVNCCEKHVSPDVATEQCFRIEGYYLVVSLMQLVMYMYVYMYMYLIICFLPSNKHTLYSLVT